MQEQRRAKQLLQRVTKMHQRLAGVRWARIRSVGRSLAGRKELVLLAWNSRTELANYDLQNVFSDSSQLGKTVRLQYEVMGMTGNVAEALQLQSRERAGVPARAARVGWRMRPGHFSFATRTGNQRSGRYRSRFCNDRVIFHLPCALETNDPVATARGSVTALTQKIVYIARLLGR